MSDNVMFVAILSFAVAFAAIIIVYDNNKSMYKCQLKYSYDTCVHTLQ